MQAELGMLTHQAQARRARERARRNNMGVFSFNPVKWGMTQDEANAYDLKQAQSDAAVAKANPGILDTLSQTAQNAEKNVGSVTTFLAWGVGIGLLAWGVTELVAERGPSVAPKLARIKLK